ncbi:hypothetical protein MYX82_07805, partial [Acidobacteria bacterium AH-259-D05]|nr:hypothetical protein [Acidobacteria bacterium AH-259-D05]
MEISPLGLVCDPTRSSSEPGPTQGEEPDEDSCSFSIDTGTFLTLSATSSEATGAGVFFDGTGSAEGCATSTCDFTITTDTALTVIWDPSVRLFFEVVITLDGSGTGEVLADHNRCVDSPCTFAYALGSLVTLRAEPSPDSSLGGFSGDCESPSSTCSFAVTADSAVTATFNPPTRQLDPNTLILVVERAGTGQGTVTSLPSGIDCGRDCTALYSSGTEVALTATAEGEAMFEGWRGACQDTGECVVVMDSHQVVAAIFDLPFAGPGPPPGAPPPEERCLTNEECESGLCVGGFCAPEIPPG